MQQSKQNMASLNNEAAASSSSSSLPRSSIDHQNHYTYEVFVSFRGEDTRSSFTDHLYTALRDWGIETFRDADKLRRGEEISAALLKAIEDSRFSIIVFSQNYASSRWCLDELVKILECRKSKGQEVIPVFYWVDPSHVRHQRGAFGDAFATLDQCKYKDRVGKWREALSDAANLSGWTYEENRSEAEFIKMIVGDLSARVANSSYDLDPCGLMSPRLDVCSLLKVEENIVRMVGIWGTGGIGKTTIAKAVFNSIRRKFECCCFLTDVRSKDLAQLQERLLHDVLRDSNLKVSSVEQRVSFIKTRMRDKKVLLILDDVSDSSQLKKLIPFPNCFGPGSRILITTRDKGWLTGRVDEVYEVKSLDDADALRLFSFHAFKIHSPPCDYLELAQHVTRYAQGLPSALIVLGSHLFRRSTTIGSCKEYPHNGIGNIFKTSYDLKGYFLDIACFFKGEHVDHVKPILEACYDLKSVIGIKQLQEQALIRIDNETFKGGRIWMHDWIEEMGKDIAYQKSPGEPGELSRVWSGEDLSLVLTNKINFSRLTCMNLSGCESLTELPDFSGIPNLKELDLSNCTSLVEIPDSIGLLDKLVTLNVGGCSTVTTVPYNTYELRNLEVLNVSRCSKLATFPEIPIKMDSLRQLFLSGSDIRELDESIRNLIGLEVLDLSDCKNLTTLPCSIYGLQNLERLYLENCSKLVRFPINTKILNVDGCPLSLPKLEWSNIRGCSLSDCDFLMTLDCWETLHFLDLSSNNFVSVPACIAKCVKLRWLFLEGCKRLREIPELPLTVYLETSGCESLIEAVSPSVEDDGQEESTLSSRLSPSTEPSKRHHTPEEPSRVISPKRKRAARQASMVHFAHEMAISPIPMIPDLHSSHQTTTPPQLQHQEEPTDLSRLSLSHDDTAPQKNRLSCLGFLCLRNQRQ